MSREPSSAHRSLPHGRGWAARVVTASSLCVAFLPAVANAAPPAAAPSLADPVSGETPDWAAIEREAKVLRLGIAGGMMFAQTYTTTALVATGALLICWHDRDGKYCGLESAQSAWYELYIPVAGPFVALRHDEVRSNWRYTAAFSLSGAMQTVGVTLAAVSLLWPKTEVSYRSLPLSVVATRDSQTLAYRGSF
ncbi:MAG TPA: hypothetical protein VI197_11605 [Polyangiaceae bacterium]